MPRDLARVTTSEPSCIGHLYGQDNRFFLAPRIGHAILDRYFYRLSFRFCPRACFRLTASGC